MKKIATNVITFIIIAAIVIGGIIIYRGYKKKNEITAEYEFVIKKFEKKSELVVGDAAIETSAKQEFTSDATKDWPSWTEPIVKTFVGRTIELKIPVKTEFKIVLKDISKDDIRIDKHNNLIFTKPLTVNVDSQIEGEIEIINSKSGLVDKTVDVLTAGKKAQEFFSEKSVDAVYSTSEHVMKDKKAIEKVVEASEEALENVLNISSDKEIKVVLTAKDLKFVNIDPKSKSNEENE